MKLSSAAIDILEAALIEIALHAPFEMPEDWRGCGNEDDAAISASNREHFRLANLARAALLKAKDGNLILKLDGSDWCAHRLDFTNLQESIAGFGSNPVVAYEKLKSLEAKP